MDTAKLTLTTCATPQTTNASIAPREYQSQAINACLQRIEDRGNPLIVAPTGSGKSIMIADICRQLVEQDKRVLIVTHRKELLTQNERHVKMLTSADIGVYSAGLGRKEAGEHVLIAGIQSIFRKPALWAQRDAVIIDEAHLVPPPGQGGMYDSMLAKLPNAIRIGLTATPYRLDSNGLIYGHGQWFDDVAYQIESKSLIPEYLSPLVNVRTLEKIDTSGVATRQGDYAANELEKRADAVVDGTLREAKREADRWNRQHILVFAVGIKHAEHVAEELSKLGEQVDVVHGQLSDDERDGRIAAFTEGTTRWLVNVGILTTGFDFPALDCIVMLRPTKSKALHVQCLGRGMRKADGKQDCLVLDFAGNIGYHGDIDIFQGARMSAALEEKAQQEAEEAKKRARRRNLQGSGDAGEMMPGKANPRGHQGNGNNGRQVMVDIPQDLQLDAESNPMTGAAATVARVISVRYELSPSKRGRETNVVTVYTTEKHGVIRRWSCPEYNSGAKWYAVQYAKSRGIRHPARDARSFMAQLKSSAVPTFVEIAKDGRWWKVNKEYFEPIA